MNAESGSTTEFTGQRSNYPQSLGGGGSNTINTS